MFLSLSSMAAAGGEHCVTWIPHSWTEEIISIALDKHNSNIFTGMDWRGLVWDSWIQELKLIQQKCSEITSLVNAVKVTCYILNQNIWFQWGMHFTVPALVSLLCSEEYLETLIFQISAFTNNDLVEGSSSRHFIARDLQRGEAWPSRERID